MSNKYEVTFDKMFGDSRCLLDLECSKKCWIKLVCWMLDQAIVKLENAVYVLSVFTPTRREEAVRKFILPYRLLLLQILTI